MTNVEKLINSGIVVLNPVCLSEIKLLVMRWGYKLLNKIISNILPETGRRDTGR